MRTHLIFLDFIFLIIFSKKTNLCSSSLCNFVQPPVTSSHLHPNILLSTLFSDTLNLRSSLKMTHQVSYPHKTTDKITVLGFNLHVFRYPTGRQKILNGMVASISRIWSTLNFLVNVVLIFYCCSLIFDLCHMFKGFISSVYIMMLSCSLVTRHE
jgi:hypothetical protein